ncbi:MAG: transcriptional regulator [Nitriliruptoraceae bacterium]|nr:transcriptional regulator [Nitriliruptoraceae bacterium]
MPMTTGTERVQDDVVSVDLVDEPSPSPVPTASEAEEQEATYQKRLGAQLRTVRRGHGMRLQDVEDASEGRFKAVVIGSYERGDRAVSATKLAALADFYGVGVADLLPDQPRVAGSPRGRGVRVDVDRLRELDGSLETAPLLRLASHVQWLRADYAGRVLSLREDDLRTVAIALGIAAEEMESWLRDRGLIID